MRLWVWAEKRKRHHVGRLIAQNFVIRASAANASQFGNAIAVCVDLGVCLDVKNAAHHFRVFKRALLIALAGLDVKELEVCVAGGGVLLDLVGVVAELDHVADGQVSAVRDQVSVFQAASIAIDHNLFWGHRLDFDFANLLAVRNANRVHRLGVVARRHAFQHVDLNVGVAVERRQSLVIQVLELVALRLL